MQRFVLPTASNWQESLDQLEANTELLRTNPEDERLWYFMEACLDAARVQWMNEKEAKERKHKLQHTGR